jgi:hypothetical protein
MSGTKPAHVLGDVLREFEHEGTKYYDILVQGFWGRQEITIPSQYVVVGDELDDLYPDLEETDE